MSLRWPVWLPPATILTATCIALAVMSKARSDQVWIWFLGAISVGFLSLWWAYRRTVAQGAISPGAVLAVAVLLHSIGLFGAPLFEDDHYRYLWDGYRFVETGTPYGTAPAEHFEDENVPPAMRRVLDGVNYPEIPTIYAPILQYAFALSYLIDHGELWPLKSLLILCNLALIAVLLKTATPRMVLLYAWNPLVFKEVALTAHPDALLALPLLLAWSMRHRVGVLSQAALMGVAIAIKVSALPALAWLLWRNRWWGIPVAVAVAAATYLPFAGFAGDLPGLQQFARDWRFNAFLYQWLLWVFAPDQAKLICAVAGVSAMFWIQYRERASDNCPPWHLVFGVLLLCAPVVNPWYLLWLLPFAVYRRECWPWVASAAVCLSYVTGLNTSREDLAAFEVAPWAQGLEWALIAIAVAIDVVRRRRESQNHGTVGRRATISSRCASEGDA